MATSKLFSSFFLVISWTVFVGFAQQTPEDPGTALSCLQKLIPCQLYLKKPSNPPPTCCIELKKVVADNQQCVCQVFNNPKILKALNITQNDALQLAQSCNANADPSVCKTVGRSPSASPAPSTCNSSSKTNSPANSPSNSAAVGVGATLGVSMVMVFFLFLMLLNLAEFESLV